MDKMKMRTPDLTDENIERLAALFPNVITEIKDESGAIKKAIDFDLLKQVLSKDIVEGDDERYRLDWPGKKASLLKANTPITKTLRPCREESVNFDTTENLYIEGDNFEVLKILQESYLGKVKMIYIDPPYNTGNDFIYKDDFAKSKEEYEEEIGVENEEGGKLFRNTDSNGRFHSDWLSMMCERLVVARDLLCDEGVIFISIDDNELHNLRKICDEIFGEENFVGNLSVENNPKGRKNSDFISVSSEYCAIYAKNKEKARFIENVPKKASDMTEDEDGNFVHGSGKRVLVGENSFNKYVSNANSDKNYSIYYRAQDRKIVVKKEKYNGIDQQLIDEGYIKYYSHNNGRLVENTYTESKFCELFEKCALEFSSDKVYEKNFSDTIRIKSQLINREYEAIVRGKKQNYSMELTTTGAGTYIKNLFEVAESPFSSPKNVGYLKLLISLFEKESFIVLDFFSGSSTAADAVMQLNAEDGGNRKFIMVQLPENLDENLSKAGNEAEKKTIQSAISICDEMNKPHLLTVIGKERIRRAGMKIVEGIKAKNQQPELGQEPVDASKLDIGFRVYKTDESNMKDVFYHPAKLDQKQLAFVESNIKEDRTPEDLLTQVILDLGLELSLPIETKKIGKNTVFIVQTNALVACFDNDIDFKIVDTIAGLKPFKVVFKDASFKDDKDRINVEERFKSLSPETKVTVI
ncbi:MAG: site-specific DNA-methyltransferase [Bacteroidales bacterium]|jgi:adenine-specific DNA-methyltransferase